MRIGHVHLKVADLAVSERFYVDLLGLHVTERVGEHFVFLSFGAAHHDVALQSAGRESFAPDPSSTGLYHTAFEVQSAAELLEVLDRITAVQAPVSLVDHGISWAIYTSDPDSNGVEVFLDMRKQAEGRAEWKGNSHRLTRTRIASAV